VAVAEGVAGELPFPDGCFDAVLSAGDTMSASDPDGAAAELLRVCRRGGRPQAPVAVGSAAMSAARELEYGAHLPLIDLGQPRSLPALAAYVRTAARLGYRYLCANDHLVFGRPWLDGPTALPVLRGPVQLARP
jgi:ubiquinone/menaquinone biosynthesis C-methylase UbiE